MLSERIFSFEQRDVVVIVSKGESYFRASDVTAALDYADAAQAVRKNVDPKYVRTLKELQDEAAGMNPSTGQIHLEIYSGRSPLYISEPGVIELVWHSKKPEALRFRRWVLEEVLPEIRKTGRYVKYEQMSLMNETDLHYKVVDFIRKFFVEAILVPGLGELQDSQAKQSDAWSKGYKSGQPDIIILNRTRKASGLAIEFKTPLGCGTNSVKQAAFQQSLRKNKFDVLLSHSYDEIVVKILEFRDAARRCSPVHRVRSSVE